MEDWPDLFFYLWLRLGVSATCLSYFEHDSWSRCICQDASLLVFLWPKLQPAWQLLYLSGCASACASMTEIATMVVAATVFVWMRLCLSFYEVTTCLSYLVVAVAIFVRMRLCLSFSDWSCNLRVLNCSCSRASACLSMMKVATCLSSWTVCLFVRMRLCVSFYDGSCNLPRLVEQPVYLSGCASACLSMMEVATCLSSWAACLTHVVTPVSDLEQE